MQARNFRGFTPCSRHQQLIYQELTAHVLHLALMCRLESEYSQ